MGQRSNKRLVDWTIKRTPYHRIDADKILSYFSSFDEPIPNFSIFLLHRLRFFLISSLHLFDFSLFLFFVHFIFRKFLVRWARDEKSRLV